MSARDQITRVVTAELPAHARDQGAEHGGAAALETLARATLVLALVTLLGALGALAEHPWLAGVAILSALLALAAVPTRGRVVALALVAVVLADAAAGLEVAVLAGTLLAPLAAWAWRESRTLHVAAMPFMDRALFAQTYPGRAMTTHHVLEVAEPFERAALQRALRALCRDIPVLRSVTRAALLDALRVHVDPDERAPLLEWHDAPIELTEHGWYARAFDLAREAPIRVLHAPRRDGGFQLVLTLHHGATDGVGAMIVLDALLRRYDLERGEDVAPPAPIAPPTGGLGAAIARRGPRFALTLAMIAARRASHFASRRAALLEARELEAGPLSCVVTEIPSARWSELAARARALGCSRNDLLLASFTRAAVQWRRERGHCEREPLRALVPVDLRGELGVGRAMHNWFGALEVDVTHAEADAPELVHRIAARLRAQREPEQAMATPLTLAVLGRVLPQAAFRALFRWTDGQKSAFMYSFLFSQIRVDGGVHLPASVEPERLYCLSALPRQPGVGLTITALARSVTVAMAYTPPRLSHEGARALMARFEEVLNDRRAIGGLEADSTGAGAERSLGGSQGRSLEGSEPIRNDLKRAAPWK